MRVADREHRIHIEFAVFAVFVEDSKPLVDIVLEFVLGFVGAS